ncbi:hypothetical protein GJAV_G00157990 [Gymnothorax javanicus]|nr:hypothetical protein GJAV_G00157980 [Gymnothorax javanicus]KAJ8261751.1 hypothetical protein GJAV_G00157990 [Gymnothorax javanicus]
MESYHQNRQEDRRWKFYCCKLNGVCNHHCYWTPYVNHFDEQFTYHVPHLNYLAGAGSYHANRQEDRRWRYLHCARSPC